MIDIQINGIASVQNEIKDKVDPAEVEQALIKGGLMIEGEAKKTCRDMKAVDTGRLMGSISTNWGSNSGAKGDVESPALPEDGVDKPDMPSGTVAAVRVGTNVEYAEYVHDGTRRMPPRPFLEAAANNKESEITEMIDRLIEKQK